MAAPVLCNGDTSTVCTWPPPSWHALAGAQAYKVTETPFVRILPLSYEEDYTDAAGQTHVLCTGNARCCGGGVWGDVMPAGERLLCLARLQEPSPFRVFCV